MRFAIAGNAGTATTTAASAGLIELYQPAALPLGAPRIYEWEIGPQANSADETYGVQLRRYNAGTPTITTVVAAAQLDVRGAAATALTLGGCGLTVTWTTGGATCMRTGYHLRGGYRWVSIPGGEFTIEPRATYAIDLEYIFAQGSSVQGGTIMFDE